MTERPDQDTELKRNLVAAGKIGLALGLAFVVLFLLFLMVAVWYLHNP